VSFVKGAGHDLYIRAQNFARGQIPAETVEHGQGVRGHGGTSPLNDVAVIIVMRGFDQRDMKSFA